MAVKKKTSSAQESHKHVRERQWIGRAFQLMEKYNFRIATAINAVPFTYNRETRRFSLPTRRSSSIKYILWFLVVFMGILVETAQVGWELWRAKNDDGMNRGEWALIAFIFSSWTFVIGLHYNVAKRGDVMVNHLNQAIATREWFTEARLPKSGDHKYVRAHIISSCLQCFFQCLMVAAEGTKAHFLYSNVPAEYRNPLTGVVWVIYAYYRVMTNFLCGYLQYFAGALHVQTCNQILALRSKGEEDVRVNLKYYRMLQILCNRYGEAHSGVFIPVITRFACENLILGIYGTVKFYDQLDTDKYMNFPLMVVMMIIFVFSFYPKYATVYETTRGEKKQALKLGMKHMAGSMWKRRPPAKKIPTEKVIVTAEEATGILMNELGKGLRRQQQRRRSSGQDVLHTLPGLDALKEMKCIARSCPAVAIPFGSLYKIKQSTVLNLFDFIACNTISTLLTYP